MLDVIIKGMAIQETDNINIPSLASCPNPITVIFHSWFKHLFMPVCIGQV